ncbi:autotransporter assembly complex family protein [Fodinicurvata sp. EGI_FJ10296]|uniref:autotransporter assembly complex protein TamA n=1 Tax=Fodinicurvata sp. EGI_FJ10296 TaxID=3231908 RepID=UPI003456A1AD
MPPELAISPKSIFATLAADRRAGRAAVLSACVIGVFAGGIAVPVVFAQMIAPRIESMEPAENFTTPELSVQPVPYRADLEIEGTLPEDGVRAVEDSVNLLSLAEEEPPSAVGLIRRAEADRDRIRGALSAFGYYDPDIRIDIDGIEVADPELRGQLSARTSDAPVPVSIVVDPGPQFTLALYEVEAVDGGPLPIELEPGSPPTQTGVPALSQTVLQYERSVISQLRDAGYALARVADRDAVVDFETQEMEVVLSIDPGGQARVGPMIVSGLEHVEEDFVQGRRPFSEGDLYSPETISELRESLSEPGVFSSIRIDPADSLNEQGRLPLEVTVEERPRRVIGFGGDYSTTEGFGLQAFWRHRNLFGRAEQFGISAAIARLGETEIGRATYRLETTFRKPDYLTRDQALLIDAVAVQDNPLAYDRRSFSVSAALERQVTERLTVSAGVSLEALRIVDAQDVERDFGLIGVPLSLRYEATDDLLDPSEGFRITTSLTPYTSVLGEAGTFAVGEAEGSIYEDFGSEGTFIAAGRVGFGFVATDKDMAEIPANLRFYAGGGGSVRGYRYQSIGPRDEQGRPIGGLSLIESSAEVRYRVTDTIGVVPFVDAGMVFDDPYPNLDAELQIGAGLGVRYYTGFGPIRADIAVPVNKRDGDDDYALYISIGQSF